MLEAHEGDTIWHTLDHQQMAISKHMNERYVICYWKYKEFLCVYKEYLIWQFAEAAKRSKFTMYKM
jgi:hypothetical protein